MKKKTGPSEFARSDSQAITRERLRRSYRPRNVQMLFVGESPPASGRFFYQEDSGLYRAMRNAFVIAFPQLQGADFLGSFRDLGCYLIDLCGTPVDHLSPRERRHVCNVGEARLSRMIRQLQPRIMVPIVRSIAANVLRAEAVAGWTGERLELPYPGQWQSHRDAFTRALVPVLRRTLRPEQRDNVF